MYELLAELTTELGALALYGLGSLLVTAVGLVAEYNGFQHYAAGEQTLAVWFGYMGLVALFAGYRLARGVRSASAN